MMFEGAWGAGICGAAYRRVERGTEQYQNLHRGFIESLVTKLGMCRVRIFAPRQGTAPGIVVARDSGGLMELEDGRV